MRTKGWLFVRFLAGVVSLFGITTLVCIAAEGQTPDTATLIAAGTLPLPEHLRAGATVVTQTNGGASTVLKKGANGMVCTNASTRDTYSAYCFSEPVFALFQRAAELSKQLSVPDTSKPVTDAVEKEIKGGKLALPRETTVGFALSGPMTGYNPATNTVTGYIKSWQMIMVPFATGKTLDLPEQSSKGMPWVMAAGTWMAHIMVEH
jgi:hypothetical protein